MDKISYPDINAKYLDSDKVYDMTMGSSLFEFLNLQQ